MDGALVTVLCVTADVERARVNRARLTDREWDALLLAASLLTRCLEAPDEAALFGVIFRLALRTRRTFRYRGEVV